ncbi:hypothetical protein [Desulfoscipio gibsoniae]
MKKSVLLILVLGLSLFLLGCNEAKQVKIEPETYKIEGWSGIPQDSTIGSLYIDKDYALVMSPSQDDFGVNKNGEGGYNNQGLVFIVYNLTDSKQIYSLADFQLIDKEDNLYTFDYQGIEIAPYSKSEQLNVYYRNPSTKVAKNINDFLNGLKYKGVTIDFNQDHEIIQADQVPAKIKEYQDKLKGSE